MLAGAVQVAKNGEFRHTDFRYRHFGHICGKRGLILALKYTLMDANGRRIGAEMTPGLQGREKQGISGSREPYLTIGSSAGRSDLPGFLPACISVVGDPDPMDFAGRPGRYRVLKKGNSVTRISGIVILG